jgi:hypothetical protein
VVSRAGAAAKGARGEREVEALWEAGGFLQTQRSRAGREDDRGDLAGIPHLTVEVKTYSDLARSIRDGLTDLVREQANNRTRWGVVFAKRRMKGWVAVMPGEEFVRLYAALYGIEEAERVARPSALQGDAEELVVPAGELPEELGA